MVDKSWDSYWWVQAWYCIIWITLVQPLTESHIISWCIKFYSLIPVYLWFTVCNSCIRWKSQYKVHLLCIIDKCQYRIVWMPPWWSLYWCITWNRNVIVVWNLRYNELMLTYICRYNVLQLNMTLLLIYLCIFIFIVMHIKMLSQRL